MQFKLSESHCHGPPRRKHCHTQNTAGQGEHMAGRANPPIFFPFSSCLFPVLPAASVQWEGAGWGNWGHAKVSCQSPRVQRMAGSGEATETWSALTKKILWATVLEIPIGRLRHLCIFSKAFIWNLTWTKSSQISLNELSSNGNNHITSTQIKRQSIVILRLSANTHFLSFPPKSSQCLDFWHHQ